MFKLLLLVSLFVFTSCSVNPNQSSINSLSNTQRLVHLTEDEMLNIVNTAKDSAFKDGSFRVHPQSKEYTAGLVCFSPPVASYLEKKQYYFYFHPDMRSYESITVIFRNGNYGGKFINNEAVHVNRTHAVMEESFEPVYQLPTTHNPNEVLVDTSGYKLYKIKVLGGANWVSPNYTSTPGDQGTKGQWESFIPADQEGSSKPGEDVNIQFGFTSHILVKFNPDNTLDMLYVSKLKSYDKPWEQRLFIVDWNDMVIFETL
ncbi:MAG: hypothetical protein ACRCTQ_07180 [Brevinemataceae bacterium]